VKIEGVFHEKTVTVGGSITSRYTPATCAHNGPTISTVRTPVPEKHTSMTTMLEHFEPDETPSSNSSPSFPIAPSVQAVIVDCIPVVNPQLASIIRNDAVSVIASPEDSHTSCPTRSKVIASGKARPPSTRVPIVHCLTPTSHLGPATSQVRAPTTHTKVECIFSEMAMTICCMERSLAAGSRDLPSITSINTSVPV
jgi:hypothetical protein